MKPHVFVLLWTSVALSHQDAEAKDECVCDLLNIERSFPHEQFASLRSAAATCAGKFSPQQAVQMDSLLLGLERRLPQLLEDMATLEAENDGDLYGLLSLILIHNELQELQQLVEQLNSTTRGSQRLITDTGRQLQELTTELKTLEQFDTEDLVRRQSDNERLKRDLEHCRNGHLPPTAPPAGAAATCPHGHFFNVSTAKINTAGEYPGSYKVGAWGRDPKPQDGKESWYWLVPMTSSNKYANYVRQYSSLSSLTVGVSVPGNVQIHASNPTTNTIQGPNVVVFAGALYYNCYNQGTVCRLDLVTKDISTVRLPEDTRYNSKANFCHLDECYQHTDLDLATDESGVWVVYTTKQHFGNMVLSKVEAGQPPALGRTWVTSVFKQSVSNTFVVCGVLYATRFVDKLVEEIFYSYDTATGEENFHVGIFIQKLSTNIFFLNYSPVDRMLHAYCDGNMVAYRALFQRDGIQEQDTEELQ
ncbi:olfactomedin-4-like isoform 1-T1 [Synchiropus picturatus]